MQMQPRAIKNNRPILFSSSLLFSLNLLHQRADDEALTRLLQTSVSGRLTNHGQVDAFILQASGRPSMANHPLPPSASLEIPILF